MRELKALLFPNSRAAYDATQIGEAPLGTVLLIPSEGVVGLAWTWPIAITAACGELHSIADASKADEIMREAAWGTDQLLAARDFALLSGAPLAPWAALALDPLRTARLADAGAQACTLAAIQLAASTPGEFVKVRALLEDDFVPPFETLLLEVLSATAERVIGRISCPAVYSNAHGLSLGDRVACEPRHIFPAEEA